MVCVIVRRPVPSTGPVPLADPAALGPIGTPAAPTPYWPGREVEAGGVTLHVRETPGPGTGETAVYVHGLGGSSNNWTELAAALSGRCHGYAVDLPGFGRTPPAVDGRLPARGARGHGRRLPRGPPPAGGRARAPARQLARRRGVAAGRRRATRPRAHADPRQPGHARPAPAALTPRRQARGAGAPAPARWTRPGRAGGAHAPRPARPHHGALPRRPGGGRPARLRHGRRGGGGARGARVGARGAAPLVPGAGGHLVRAAVALAVGRRRRRSPRRRWWCGASSTVSSAWDAPPRTAATLPAGRLLRLSGVGHVAQIERPEIVARAVLGLFDGAADGSWPAAGCAATPDR